MVRMLYWISFASEERFLGVVIVEADTLTGALAAARNRAACGPPTRGSHSSLSSKQERLERPVDRATRVWFDAERLRPGADAAVWCGLLFCALGRQ